MSDAAIRVLIADDHAPTRADIRRILENDSRFDVVADAHDAAAAVEAAVSERPDVCLLDVQMPGSGVGAAWEISARLPQTKIVMLTVSREDQHLFSALRAGASGYLLKDMDATRLPHALSDVIQGKAALPRDLTARLVEEFRDRGPRRRTALGEGDYAALTSREWQVLDMLRQELSTSEIARRLSLSPVTVRTHVNSILKKVRAPNRAALRDLEPR
jgi:two-component system, NarL family, nitrate/nitrite response regulator NarL